MKDFSKLGDFTLILCIVIRSRRNSISEEASRYRATSLRQQTFSSTNDNALSEDLTFSINGYRDRARSTYTDYANASNLTR